MSLALIAQIESNAVNGGSIQGVMSGTDSVSAADTFYGRRLTTLLANESGSGVTFSPSTGGASAGVISTPGSITCVPGTYQIDISAVYSSTGTAGNVVLGWYNVTSSGFELNLEDSSAMLATTWLAGTSTVANVTARLSGAFTVTTSNKTYNLYHKGTDAVPGTSVIRNLAFCGACTTMTTANVTNASGAVVAARNTYCLIRLLKTA